MNDELYLERMEQSLVEKLWFTKRVNLKQYDLIIDFGCANGKLLSKLSSFDLNPDVYLLGYEPNINFLIQTNIYDIIKNKKSGMFTEKWDIVLGHLQLSKKSLIIFSSVMHEMDKEEINEKLNDLVIYGVDTICIRDMCFIADEEQEISSSIAYGYVGEDENPYKRDLRKKIQTITDDFERQKILTEYLLKYRYVENYERESKEEYFSTDFDDIKNQLKNGGYEDLLMFHYTNNYIKNRVKEDFGIDLTHKTHILALFTKKGE